MRIAVFFLVSAVSVVVAIAEKDYSWLIPPVVLLLLGLGPSFPRTPRKKVRRPDTGAAAAGTAVGAAGTVAAASWWADGAHTHGGDTADASGGDGGGGDGGDGGGCGGCGGCGCGG
ncbi:hypothetical protein ACIBLA_03445 [Streptomyces sp. NPDC050433]|uniref:hypothetical protein n=1 Tax=unclassified Streptomyces TaxID=2593676 RepID=UPI0034125A28